MSETKRIPIEIPSDCTATFDEENNVLIISKKKEEVYIPDSVDEIDLKNKYMTSIECSTKERLHSFYILSNLVEMRDASNGGWRADWRDGDQSKWTIEFDDDDEISLDYGYYYRKPLAFKSEEIARAFLNKHREMILTAKELL